MVLDPGAIYKRNTVKLITFDISIRIRKSLNGT